MIASENTPRWVFWLGGLQGLSGLCGSKLSFQGLFESECLDCWVLTFKALLARSL